MHVDRLRWLVRKEKHDSLDGAAELVSAAPALLKKIETYQTALQQALVAMRLAAALPGVSDEYDFDPAMKLVEHALRDDE